MTRLFRLSDQAWAAMIDICRAANLVRLASMIVASSVEFCTFSRPDVVGATYRPNMVRPPWSQRGLWQRLFEQIYSFWRCSSRTQPRQFACEGAPLGSRRKRGEWAQAVGRWRGGRTSKIHCLADDRGRPVAFALTPGNVADISMAVPLLSAVTSPKHLIADKAYDADSLHNWLKTRRIKAVIPCTATTRRLSASQPYRRPLLPSQELATLGNTI